MKSEVCSDATLSVLAAIITTRTKNQYGKDEGF